MAGGPLLLRSSPYDSMVGGPRLLTMHIKQQQHTAFRYKPWARADALPRTKTPEEMIARCDKALKQLEKHYGPHPQLRAPHHAPPAPPTPQRTRPQSAVNPLRTNSSRNRNRPQSAATTGRGRGGYDVTRLRRLTKIPGKLEFNNIQQHRWARNTGRKLASDDLLRSGIRETLELRHKLSPPRVRK